MTDGFFRTLPYPGRFIIIGKDADAYVILSGATGRSPSSLRRRYVEKEDGIYTEGTDGTAAREGNPELLLYPALRFFPNGIVVANGRHIERITSLGGEGSAEEKLSRALAAESYEPDEYRTPRITGCLIESDGGMEGALHIARSSGDETDRSSWEVPFKTGEGLFISTYSGENVRPTPSFSGDPLSFPLNFGSPERAAKGLFAALAPAVGKDDYRVGCFALYKTSGQRTQISMVNRLDA